MLMRLAWSFAIATIIVVFALFCIADSLGKF